MKLSPNHLKRYKEILALFWKYGRSDLVRNMGMDEAIDVSDLDRKDHGEVDPAELANDLEAMGPTYVKLGQILAGRKDLLPDPYLKALERLQDQVKPFPFKDVEKIVTVELGVRLSKAFHSFDEVPLAAASLGQVHAAQLRDGRPVVVKIQRPNIRRQIAEDFEVLADVASFLDAHTAIGRRYRFTTIVEEFRVTIRNELNYEREAQNLIAVGKNLEEFELIQVPQPIPDYSTKSILTMDYVRGKKVTSVTRLARLETDGRPLAEAIFKAYLKQVLVDGLFHADPHPGNVFLTDDGRIALLDLGMVGHTAPGMQESLIKLLLAISEGRSEEVGDLVMLVGEKTNDFDQIEFRRRIRALVSDRQDFGDKKLNVGASLLEVTRSAVDTGLHAPRELTMLGKTLLQLDDVGRILDPTFVPNESIKRNVAEMMSQRMFKDVTQGNFLRSVLEMKDFFAGLPSRVNRIMDVVADQEIEIKVKAVDAELVMEGFQKIANRITTGLVLGALILGACILMQVQTSFQIFGYPGFAMLCFLLAATGGFWLVINIFIQDHKDRKNSTQ